jgi:hypothetical protein
MLNFPVMKSVFEKTTRDNLLNRAGQLTQNSTAQWGKMNVCQMMKHCRLADEMFLGKKKYNRVFIGLLLGRMGLKRLLKDEKPMPHNAPTGAALKIKENDLDFSDEKNKWITVIDEYGNFSNPDFVHWFFGKMTEEQVGRFAYKHIDHHLRQFGV